VRATTVFSEHGRLSIAGRSGGGLFVPTTATPRVFARASSLAGGWYEGFAPRCGGFFFFCGDELPGSMPFRSCTPRLTPPVSAAASPAHTPYCLRGSTPAVRLFWFFFYGEKLPTACPSCKRRSLEFSKAIAGSVATFHLGGGLSVGQYFGSGRLPPLHPASTPFFFFSMESTCGRLFGKG